MKRGAYRNLRRMQALKDEAKAAMEPRGECSGQNKIKFKGCGWKKNLVCLMGWMNKEMTVTR